MREEAARRGLAIERSELIGLMPQQALLDVASHYLQLEGLHAGRILEWQISQKQRGLPSA